MYIRLYIYRRKKHGFASSIKQISTCLDFYRPWWPSWWAPPCCAWWAVGRPWPTDLATAPPGWWWPLPLDWPCWWGSCWNCHLESSTSRQIKNEQKTCVPFQPFTETCFNHLLNKFNLETSRIYIQ